MVKNDLSDANAIVVVWALNLFNKIIEPFDILFHNKFMFLSFCTCGLEAATTPGTADVLSSNLAGKSPLLIFFVCLFLTALLPHHPILLRCKPNIIQIFIALIACKESFEN